MSIERKCYATRDEWLSLRAGMDDMLGGSEVGVAAGHSPYDSAYSMFCKKIGLIPERDISLNESIVQGHDLEENVADRFSRISGKKVYEDKCIFTNSDFPHLKATPDRLMVDEDSGLECKTAKAESWKKNDEGDFPLTYLDQCGLYLAVTQRKRWYLAALIYGTAFKTFLLTRVEAEVERYKYLKAKFDEILSDDDKRHYFTGLTERVEYFESVREGLGITDDADVADFTEWVVSWCYIEAAYYIDDEFLEACETVARQFLERKNAVERFMSEQKWGNEDERLSLLAAAAAQVWPNDEIDDSESTSYAIGEIYPESVPGTSVALDGAFVHGGESGMDGRSYRDLLNDRAAAKTEIARLEGVVGAIENALALKLGSAEKGVLDGWSISYKTSSTARIDSDMLAKHFGGKIPKEFYKVTQSRRWYIREKKS